MVVQCLSGYNKMSFDKRLLKKSSPIFTVIHRYGILQRCSEFSHWDLRDR